MVGRCEGKPGEGLLSKLVLDTYRNCISYFRRDLIVDTAIRAQSAIILCNFMKSPNAAEFRANLLTDLLSLLGQNKNKRYFDNSHLHRLKHRVMQTLLILEPFLNEVSYKLMCKSSTLYQHALSLLLLLIVHRWKLKSYTILCAILLLPRVISRVCA